MGVTAERRHARIAVAGTVAAALWFGSGLLSHLLIGTRISQAVELVLPVTVPRVMWVWPTPWGVLGLAIAVIAVTVLSWVLLTLAASRTRLHTLSAWLLITLTATAVGIAVSIGQLIAHVPLMGFFAFSLDPDKFPLAGAYWGVLYGWIPALVATHRAGRASDRIDQRSPPQTKPTKGIPASTRWWTAGLAILIIVSLTTVTTLGSRAQRVANQQLTLADGPEMPEGVTVDPYAEGEPPPESIPADGPRDPEWCTAEQATLLLGTPDAATGHRVQPIRLMNFSENDCVVEGYPDIAFADQNGNLLDVALTRGGSFMTDDPGPTAVTVPPGSYAVTSLGWNAHSTHNELVASTIFAAQVAGDTRVSWSGQPGLDIIEGSEVLVTAWELDDTYPAAD